MGGSSSKTKHTTYDVSHSVEGEAVTTNIKNNRKGSIRNSVKKKNKNSVKIKDKKSLKKSKSSKSTNSQGVNISVVEDIPDTPGVNALPNSTVYRKKSSCPSCEAKDILLGKNRSRSGSEKSLRFSDFNKVLRKTRIYDWETAPLDIPLYGVDEPRPDDICYICEVYTGSHIRACRVCCRAYHDSCLSKIGHPLSENSRRLIAANKWSCHQCVSLNHLLTQEEVRELLNELDDLDIPKDNITEVSYLKFCKHALQRDNKMFTSDKDESSTRRFRSVDKTNSGVISYTQFLNIESIRILSRRCKDSLVHLLTQAELAEARKIFQRLDSQKAGVISKLAVKKSPLTQKSLARTDFPDDTIMYIDEDVDSPVTWADFLRDTAIYILAQRPNSEDTGSLGNTYDGTEDGTLTFSSCDSLDGDDERYITCNSDVEPGVSVEDQVLSKRQTNLTKEKLDNSLEERVTPLDSSTTMLDEINSEIDKGRCKRQLQKKQAESEQDVSQATNSACEVNCTSKFSQTPAEVASGQPPSNQSQRSSKTGQAAGGHWADLDSRLPSDRTGSSPYNDSRHTPIPWEDIEKRSGQRRNIDSNTRPAHRRSEIIPRQVVTTSDQARAVSQIGCGYSKYVLAPAYDNVVGRINSEEWKC